MCSGRRSGSSVGVAVSLILKKSVGVAVGGTGRAAFLPAGKEEGRVTPAVWGPARAHGMSSQVSSTTTGKFSARCARGMAWRGSAGCQCLTWWRSCIGVGQMGFQLLFPFSFVLCCAVLCCAAIKLGACV